MARNKRTKRTQPTTKRDSAQPEPKSASARKERREKARERSRSKNQERLLLLGILAITALAYLNALDGQFVYDDQYQVLKNPTLNSLANIPRMFTQGVWQFLNEADKTAVGPYYRPLFNIALIINHHLFGLEVFGWHLFSILLHVGVVFLVYRLALRWKLSIETALASALLFGLHPVHSESVAWVAALPDPLAAVFILSSLLLYERRFHGGTRQHLLLGLSVPLALMAMLSKEVAVIFPFFLGVRELLDRPPGEKPGETVARVAKRTAPFFAIMVLYLGLRYHVLGSLLHNEPKSLGIPGSQVLLTIPSVLMSYARMLFIPVPLAVIYSNTFVQSAGDARFWAATLAVIAMIAALIWLVRRSPTGRFAVAFLIIFLLPVLNLKAFRADESLLHDRYLYLPSIGFCILVAMGLEALSARFANRRRAVFATAAMFVGAVLFGLTFYQNFSWQSELALTSNALEVAPRWPFLYNKLGAYYAEQRQWTPAEQAYLKTIEIDPKYYDAYSNLGDAYREQGKLADAEQAYLNAIEYGAPYADTHYNLGVVYIGEGKLADAEQPLLHALEISPADTKARYNLGWTYDREGKDALAEQAYAETLQRDPTYPEARINLAVLLTRQARYAEALDQLHIAQRYAPDHPVLRYALGDVNMKTQHYEEAIAAFSELAVRNLHQNLVHTSLGLCYESIGKKEEAKAQFQKAIEVAPDDPYTKTAREHLAKLLAGA
jgi:tetratricopeptide (TPR) repeat protein